MEKLLQTLKNVIYVVAAGAALYPRVCVFPKLLLISPEMDSFLLCLHLLNSFRLLSGFQEDLSSVLFSTIKTFLMLNKPP